MLRSNPNHANHKPIALVSAEGTISTIWDTYLPIYYHRTNNEVIQYCNRTLILASILHSGITAQILVQHNTVYINY